MVKRKEAKVLAVEIDSGRVLAEHYRGSWVGCTGYTKRHGGFLRPGTKFVVKAVGDDEQKR